MLNTVYVCTHALDRWRERASESAIAPEEDAINALRASRKVMPDDFLPIPREPGTHYYHHKDYGAYFVVEPIDRTSCRIVTVIVPGIPQVPILTPKKKAKPQKLKPVIQPANTPEERGQHTPATASSEVLKTTLEEVMLRLSPEDKKPVDNEAAHLYRKYVNMMHEIEGQIGGLTRNQPKRKQLVLQLSVLRQKAAELKPEYRRYLNDLNNRNNDKPIREDGSVNYVAAILHLLRKTEEQQKEIEELKNTVAFLSAS